LTVFLVVVVFENVEIAVVVPENAVHVVRVALGLGFGSERIDVVIVSLRTIIIVVKDTAVVLVFQDLPSWHGGGWSI
jgi:hypothetical protein